jgi:hypothetical protein
MELIIERTGEVRTIYAETIDLPALGRMNIMRVSHVEPTPDGRWLADLRMVLGPVLGPFALRSEALRAEHEWLSVHWLLPPE